MMETLPVSEKKAALAKWREVLAFSLGGIAILLRMASDWLFPQGGPLPYQMLQVAFLIMAVVAIWPRLDMIFLRGGDDKKSLKYGLVVAPLGIAFGLIGSCWGGW